MCRYETEDGYTFVRSLEDYFYYYAVHDEDGRLIPGHYKVGEADPKTLGIPQHLQHSDKTIQAALAEWEAFQTEVWAINTPTGNIRLGLIFIEFPDVPGDAGYTSGNYEDMFFSENYYHHDNGVYSPDGEIVRGSFNDYWQEVSYGNIWVEGSIINPVDESGNIEWLVADHSKNYYRADTLSVELLNEAIAKAATQFDTSGYDRLGVIYAGRYYHEGALTPRASGHTYLMCQKHEPDNMGDETFSHIGRHCHEFGHTIGMGDKYQPYDDGSVLSIGNWALMSYGRLNGPNGGDVHKGKGASPAHPDVVSKIDVGWIVPDTIRANTSVVLNVSEQYPSAVVVPIYEGTSGVADEYFIVEYRKPIGFDKYLLRNQSGNPIMDGHGGLFIWHKLYTAPGAHFYNIEMLEQADGKFDLELRENFGDTGDYYQSGELGPLTTPNSNGYDKNGYPDLNDRTGSQNNASGIHVDDIGRIGEIMSFEVVVDEWVGTITKHRVWEDNLYLMGDILVSGSNDTIIEFDGQAFDTIITFIPAVLEVSAGTNTYASTTDAQNLGNNSSRVEILVDGALNVLGSAINPVLFTSASSTPTRFDWQGIQFDPINPDTVDPHSVIQYATIEYAYIGIGSKNADPFIEHTTIQQCGYGARMTSNANPILKYNTFTNNGPIALYSNGSFNAADSIHMQYNTFENSGYGLYLINSSPKMLGNSIRSNTTRGAYLRGSSPDLYQNEFINNSGIGLYCRSGSSPQASFNEGTQWGGYNIITGNSGDGVYATASSYPNLGIMEYGKGPQGGGFNSIFSNGTYEVKNNNTSGSIFALQNWWGSPFGPDPRDLYGDVLFDPFLESPPGEAPNSYLTPPALTSAPNALGKSTTGSDSLEFYLQQGIYLFSTGQYEVAAALFEQLIEGAPDAPGIDCAVDYLVKSCRRYLSPLQTLGRVHSLTGGLQGHEVKYFLLRKTISLFEETGKYQPAVNRATQLLDYYQSAPDMVMGLHFHRGSIYKYGLNDSSSAAADFSFIVDSYPESELALAAQIELEDLGDSFFKKPAGHDIKSAPSSIELYANYPNPFNAVTTIRYDLPDVSDVRLVVYDLLGREVITLIQDRQEAGYQSVRWNGRDRLGQEVASGVYLYQLRAGDFMRTKKLVLIK